MDAAQVKHATRISDLGLENVNQILSISKAWKGKPHPKHLQDKLLGMMPHAILVYAFPTDAMPSNWGMWGAAFAEGLLEELEQLPALWSRIDRCPLGAAAGFGSPVKLNREHSAELLGFSRVQRSPIDVMNSRGRHEQAIAA